VTEAMELKAPDALFSPSYGTPDNSNRSSMIMKKVSLFNNFNYVGATSINNKSLGHYNTIKNDNMRRSINTEMETQEDIL